MIQRLRPASPYLVFTLVLAAACSDRGSVVATRRSGPSQDLQPACDSAVVHAAAAEERRLVLEPRTSHLVTAPISNLLHGDLDPTSGDLWVLDPAEAAVIAVDRSGAERTRFGRKGSGPGDLFLMPLVRFGQTVALVQDRILVLDAYRLSEFTRSGRFTRIAQVDANPLHLLPGASLGVLSDSVTILGVGQFRITSDTAFDARTTVKFATARSAGGTFQFDSLPIVLRSREWYAGGTNQVGVPLYNKFVFLIGNTWTVSGGDLVALSFGGFGFCRIDPWSGAITGAAQLTAGRRPTTTAERLALHEELPGIDQRNPDGTVWGEELDAHWPPFAPWYQHVVAGKEMIALSRSASLDEDRVDLFQGNSYAGTFTTRPSWLMRVVAIDGDSLLHVDRDSTTEELRLAWYRPVAAR